MTHTPEPSSRQAGGSAQEPPRIEDASASDLLLAIRACGSLSGYGGFIRVALGAIYAERERASAAAEDAGAL